MAIVQTFYVMPDHEVQMEVDLMPNGTVTLRFDGHAEVPCWCGREHRYRVRSDVQCAGQLSPHDLGDLEMAIRGNEKAANRLGWKIITSQIVLSNMSPCDRGED